MGFEGIGMSLAGPQANLRGHLPSFRDNHLAPRVELKLGTMPRDKRCVGGCSSELSMAVGAGIGPAAAGRGGLWLLDSAAPRCESKGAAGEIGHHIL